MRALALVNVVLNLCTAFCLAMAAYTGAGAIFGYLAPVFVVSACVWCFAAASS